MGVGNYTQKMPDLGRNEKLAGKTVYSKGFNITYNSEGYAIQAIRADFVNNDGQSVSPKAQPIEEALAEVE